VQGPRHGGDANAATALGWTPVEAPRKQSGERTGRGLATHPWAFAALLACAACGADAPLSHLPERSGLNVVVVSFDALRADALGAYGYGRRTSPNIDRLARQGVLFERAYAVSPVTPSSFAAAFTGNHPNRSFRRWRLVGTSIAEYFSDAGYSTAAFMNNPHLDPVRGFERGFDTYETFDGWADEPILGQVQNWIAAEASEPFFLWVHWIDPHTPWDWLPEAKHLYDETNTQAGQVGSGLKFKVHDSTELRRLRNLYDGEVFACDAIFARLVATLSERGLLQRTIVLLTSDHGEEFMEHGWLQHGQLNGENMRIPWILLHPDQDTGLRVPDLVSQLDILPTLAGLVGIALPENLDGRDLRMVGGDVDPLLGVANTSGQFQQASIQSAGRKLIVECGPRVRKGTHAPVQFYDLTKDPREAENLALMRADEATRLEERMWNALGVAGCEDLRMHADQGPDRELEGLDEDAVRRLEALGYLDR